jgi:hypothetical protein
LATKVAKIPFPTKCFEENLVVYLNILFQVIETESLMVLLFMAGKIPER